ncbi:MAG: hypothetical protein ILP13_01755, partial [Lachnospiraceae bacterium]|nr:hypothetical protein [Lachnospiraceae bacterium]
TEDIYDNTPTPTEEVTETQAEETPQQEEQPQPETKPASNEQKPKDTREVIAKTKDGQELKVGQIVTYNFKYSDKSRNAEKRGTTGQSEGVIGKNRKGRIYDKENNKVYVIRQGENGKTKSAWVDIDNITNIEDNYTPIETREQEPSAATPQPKQQGI